MKSVTIDLDENVLNYVENVRETNEYDNINILESIQRAVDFVINNQQVFAENIYVSIQSATKDEIQQINKEYRNIDNSTDVLSFPIFSRDEIENIVKEKNTDKKLKELELGDIILCMDVIHEQALEYQTGIVREVLYMIVHGMCHLLGYDHEIEQEKKQMRALEEKVLDEIGVSRIHG